MTFLISSKVVTVRSWGGGGFFINSVDINPGSLVYDANVTLKFSGCTADIGLSLYSRVPKRYSRYRNAAGLCHFMVYSNSEYEYLQKHGTGLLIWLCRQTAILYVSLQLITLWSCIWESQTCWPQHFNGKKDHVGNSDT